MTWSDAPSCDDGLARVLVWLVFATLLANAGRFIATYAARVMIMDDISIATALLNSGLTWDYLLRPHNEHRIPLPHLIQYSLYAASGDIRSGMWFNLALLALVAAASIAVARRVRGRTSWADAALPLAWLSTGHCETLLLGFQLSFMLPTALVVAILRNATGRSGARSGTRSSAISPRTCRPRRSCGTTRPCSIHTFSASRCTT